jgi:hypothetical protein
MKYINLTFFILAIAFISFFTYLEKVNHWNLSESWEEREFADLANAINNDFKSAVNGDAISFEPNISSYATKDVNLSHAKIVADKGKLFRENTYGDDVISDDVTALIPNKWDNRLTELSSSIDTKGERREDFFFVAIFVIVVLSLLVFANFIVALFNNRKIEKQPSLTPQLNHNKYFYLLNEEQLGPISKKELEELLTSNKIDSTTLVWCEGMEEWGEVSKVFNSK